MNTGNTNHLWLLWDLTPGSLVSLREAVDQGLEVEPVWMIDPEQVDGVLAGFFRLLDEGVIHVVMLPTLGPTADEGDPWNARAVKTLSEQLSQALRLIVDNRILFLRPSFLEGVAQTRDLIARLSEGEPPGATLRSLGAIDSRGPSGKGWLKRPYPKPNGDSGIGAALSVLLEHYRELAETLPTLPDHRAMNGIHRIDRETALALLNPLKPRTQKIKGFLLEEIAVENATVLYRFSSETGGLTLRLEHSDPNADCFDRTVYFNVLIRTSMPEAGMRPEQERLARSILALIRRNEIVYTQSGERNRE